MTYRQLIKMMRNDADFLERSIRDSQVINFATEISGVDDTIVMKYMEMVEENMANITGHHGWVVIED